MFLKLYNILCRFSLLYELVAETKQSILGETGFFVV